MSLRYLPDTGSRLMKADLELKDANKLLDIFFQGRLIPTNKAITGGVGHNLVGWRLDSESDLKISPPFTLFLCRI